MPIGLTTYIRHCLQQVNPDKSVNFNKIIFRIAIHSQYFNTVCPSFFQSKTKGGIRRHIGLKPPEPSFLRKL